MSLPRWLLPEIRPLTLLGLFLAAWVFIPPTFRAFFRTAAYEFQAPVWNTVSQGRDILDYWALRARPKRELIEAGRDLARLNAGLQIQSLETEELRRYIRRLESILDIPAAPDFRIEVARVVRRDISAWWHTLTIRKGENFDIPVGAAVLSQRGVVGRVREVRKTTAIVELISHPGFRMAASLEEDPRPVGYQGSPNPLLQVATGTVRDIAPDVRISPGSPRRLISSRLAGVFPDGFLIGHVDSLQQGPDGLYQVGRVRLNPELLQLNEVTVWIPLETKGP